MIWMKCVFEREGKAGKRLAAAGWHSKRVEPRPSGTFLPALPQHIGAEPVDRRGLCLLRHCLHRLVELREQRRQLGIASTLSALPLIHEGFRVQKVSIRKAGKEHTYPQVQPLGSAKCARIKDRPRCPQYPLGRGNLHHLSEQTLRPSS